MHARPVERLVERRIEGEIPPLDLFIEDGPHFPRPGIRGVFRALVANFVRKAQSDRPFPLRRNPHARANMASDVIPTLSVMRGSKNVEAGFKPIFEAVRDFDGFVKLMVGWISSVRRGLRALEREIAMELNHRVARLHGVVRVDLNLVVALRAR